MSSAASRPQLAAVDLQAARRVSIDAGALTKLDLTGAWALHQFVARARAAGAAVSFKGSAPDQLRLLDDTLQEAREGRGGGASRARAARAAPRLHAAAGRSRQAHGRVQPQRNRGPGVPRPHQRDLRCSSVPRPKHLRVTSIVRHVYETGITALPIVALIAFLISVIIAYMSARQLSGLGADIYVVDLVTIGVLRELGVLLTAIIVAGRSGSAFAAELGLDEAQSRRSTP